MYEVSPAERLFSEIIVRVIKRWGFVTTFRTTATKALTEIRGSLAIEQQRTINDFLNSAEAKQIFLPINPDAPPSDKEGKQEFVSSLSALVTNATIVSTQTAVDTASIVFCHSVVDAAALDYCRVIALCAPEDWEGDFSDRKIKLAEFKNATYEEIFKDKLEKFLTEIEGFSLLKKAERLFLKCRPPTDFAPMQDYKYDPERLKEIDDLRHEIVHGDRCDKGVSNVEDDLGYMFQTAFYFMGLVHHRYGLKVHSQVMNEFFQRKMTREDYNKLFYGA